MSYAPAWKCRRGRVGVVARAVVVVGRDPRRRADLVPGDESKTTVRDGCAVAPRRARGGDDEDVRPACERASPRMARSVDAPGVHVVVKSGRCRRRDVDGVAGRGRARSPSPCCRRSDLVVGRGHGQRRSGPARGARSGRPCIRAVERPPAAASSVRRTNRPADQVRATPSRPACRSGSRSRRSPGRCRTARRAGRVLPRLLGDEAHPRGHVAHRVQPRDRRRAVAGVDLVLSALAGQHRPQVPGA